MTIVATMNRGTSETGKTLQNTRTKYINQCEDIKYSH